MSPNPYFTRIQVPRHGSEEYYHKGQNAHIHIIKKGSYYYAVIASDFSPEWVVPDLRRYGTGWQHLRNAKGSYSLRIDRHDSLQAAMDAALKTLSKPKDNNP